METQCVNGGAVVIIAAGANPRDGLLDHSSSVWEPHFTTGLGPPQLGDPGFEQPGQQLMDQGVQMLISRSRIMIPCGKHPDLNVCEIPSYVFLPVEF